MERDAAVRGYGEAFFAVADAEGVLDRVQEELFALGSAIAQNPALRDALTDVALPIENRTALVRDVLGDRAHPVTLTLVGLAVEGGHAKDLTGIVDAMARLAAERRDARFAEVRSAVSLDDDQRARVAAALSRATGRSIEIRVVVDPTVVGGLVARVGDEIFDGSIANRLNEAKQHLGSV